MKALTCPLLPPVPELKMRFGVTMSSEVTRATANLSRNSPLRAVIETGVVCRFSSTRCAVTVTSCSSGVAAAAAVMLAPRLTAARVAASDCDTRSLPGSVPDYETKFNYGHLQA